MKFLYYLAAFGSPHFINKTNVLINNLFYLYRKINTPFDIIINCYETNKKNIHLLQTNLKKLNFIENVYLYKKTGVLTELFLTNPYNKIVNNYDYILFILDDVKILTFDLKDMLRIKRRYKIQLLSPKIINSTYDYMYKYNSNIVTLNNFLEIFILLLNPKDFFKFLSLYTVNNKWMWGVDHLFGYYNVTAGMANKFTSVHLYSGGRNKHIALKLMQEYLKEKTTFKYLSQIRKKYNGVYKFIHEKKKK